jgi:hypothetical protein
MVAASCRLMARRYARAPAEASGRRAMHRTYFLQAVVEVGDCLEPSVKTKSPLN